MRVMPFRVASDASITLSKPTLRFGETVVEAGDDVSGWDYLTPVTITGQFAVDPEELHRSTALNDFEPVRVVMQVNCVSTGWRSYAVTPIPTVPPFSGQLILDIPANTVADALEVHYGIVLVADITADPHSTAPPHEGQPGLHRSPDPPIHARRIPIGFPHRGLRLQHNLSPPTGTLAPAVQQFLTREPLSGIGAAVHQQQPSGG